ncbi:helicase-related protein [Nonomuraea basaltis]|uniref:helicase-related protein n=1 Tax=Nonomuraea basaltis TaxID=2495887 RepID=UPI001980CB58|nr:helicase-related protein [Nonomuraea basaltis]
MAATSPALLIEGSNPYEPLAYGPSPLEAAPGDSLYALLRDLPSYELSPKYQEAVQIVATNAAAGRKTIVWTTFVRNITTLAELLSPHCPAVVHGGTADRDEEIRRFREDPDCMLLISNPATLGEGISLHQVCHDAIYVDRDFMVGRFLQSLDRIHRLGLAPGTETRVTILVARKAPSTKWSSCVSRQSWSSWAASWTTQRCASSQTSSKSPSAATAWIWRTFANSCAT